MTETYGGVKGDDVRTLPGTHRLTLEAYEARTARRIAAGFAALAAAAVLFALVSPLPGLAVLALLAVLLGQAAPPSRRTLRWSRSVDIDAPPAAVLDAVADPAWLGRLMSPRFYPDQNPDPSNPSFGVLETTVVRGTGPVTRYVTLAAHGRLRLETSSDMRVDRAAGRVTITTGRESLGGDVIEVGARPGGSVLTYATVLRLPLWGAGILVPLVRGRQEAVAGERLEALLGRIKAELEGPGTAL